MLVALSAIESEQVKPTQQTLKKTTFFLDYVDLHSDAILTFKPSNMIVQVHSDTSYLSEPKARSHAGRYFFMSDDSEQSPNNGTVLNAAKNQGFYNLASYEF